MSSKTIERLAMSASQIIVSCNYAEAKCLPTMRKLQFHL